MYEAPFLTIGEISFFYVCKTECCDEGGYFDYPLTYWFSLLQREDEGGGQDVRDLPGWALALEQTAGDITAAIEQTLTAYAHQLSQPAPVAG